MKRKLTLVLAIVFCITVGSVLAIKSSDSLISLSYLEDTFLSGLLKKANTNTDRAFETILSDALSKAGTGENGQQGGVSARECKQKDAVTLSSGCTFLCSRGTVALSHNGTVINATTGEIVPNGSRLSANNRYIVAEETRATFTVISGIAAIIYEGGATFSAANNSSHPFLDVTTDDWYNDMVTFVYEKQLFSGTGDGTFSPQATMTRAMAMTVFYRFANSPQSELAAASASFSDVPQNAWFTPFVTWAASQQITAGTGNNTFSPDLSLTHEQMVVLLYSFAQKYLHLTLEEGKDISHLSGADKVAPWARDAMCWAYGAGIIRTENATIQSSAATTRADVANLLGNFYTLYLM